MLCMSVSILLMAPNLSGMVSNEFETFWKKLNGKELKNIRAQIKEWNDERVGQKNMVNRLSRDRKKLSEKWKATRVVRTEEKKIQTKEVRDAGKKFGKEHFKILLSPNACALCHKVTGEEQKIFSKDAMKYKGHLIPPIHPNCTCRAVIVNPES